MTMPDKLDLFLQTLPLDDARQVYEFLDGDPDAVLEMVELLIASHKELDDKWTDRSFRRSWDAMVDRQPQMYVMNHCPEVDTFIAPNADMLAIARLYLEKYETLESDDRKLFRSVISVFNGGRLGSRLPGIKAEAV